MSSRVGRWGGSLSVRLPKNVAVGAGLKAGDHVYVRLRDNGEVSVRPVKGVQPVAIPSSALRRQSPRCAGRARD